MSDKTIYFSGLNGLRAIAAIAVVISHITLGLGSFGLDAHLFGTFADGKPKGLSLAGYGVSIFFVLSGFLITFLLQTEKENAEINIKKFYLRRILRIWPLYYAYLFICVALMIFYNSEIGTINLLFYIFYAPNIPFILGGGIGLVAHYWSLGVEEQFYLFWPWLNKKIDNLLVLLILLIMSLITIKIALHFLYPNSILEMAIHVTRFHCMMIGGVGAILYKQKHTLFLQLTDNKISQGICWFILFLVAINKYHFASIIDNEIISVVGLVVIIGQINIKNRLINLENSIFDFLGKISYGIYVIHPLLIFLIAKIFVNLEVISFYKYLIVYFVVLMATILTAYLSYTYMEKYFLDFKKRFEVVKSASTNNNLK